MSHAEVTREERDENGVSVDEMVDRMFGPSRHSLLFHETGGSSFPSRSHTFLTGANTVAPNGTLGSARFHQHYAGASPSAEREKARKAKIARKKRSSILKKKKAARDSPIVCKGASESPIERSDDVYDGSLMSVERRKRRGSPRTSEEKREALIKNRDSVQRCRERKKNRTAKLEKELALSIAELTDLNHSMPQILKLLKEVKPLSEEQAKTHESLVAFATNPPNIPCFNDAQISNSDNACQGNEKSK